MASALDRLCQVQMVAAARLGVQNAVVVMDDAAAAVFRGDRCANLVRIQHRPLSQQPIPTFQLVASPAQEHRAPHPKRAALPLNTRCESFSGIRTGQLVSVNNRARRYGGYHHAPSLMQRPAPEHPSSLV